MTTPLRPVHIPVIGTLLAPMSHHDPDHTLEANTTPFRRRAQVVQLNAAPAACTQEQLDRVLAAFPVPADIAEFLTPLSAPEFLALCAVFSFVDAFRSYDGAGLFEGVTRYERLSARLTQAARRAHSLHSFWSDLTAMMQVGGAGHSTPALLRLLSLPQSLAQHVLIAIGSQAESLVMLAREWADTSRKQSEQYAAKAGVTQASAENVTLAFDAAALPAPARTAIREIPAVSGNALRHTLVREAGALHMLDALGIAQEQLSPGVGALLFNGGAIRKGSKAPTSENAIGHAVIDRYPLLELVSGCVDAFLLPEGALALTAHLVATENAAALAPWDIHAEHPAEALIDRETLTRRTFRAEEGGGMIYTFETMSAGTQFLMVCTLRPYVSPLAAGALWAALRWARDARQRVGGQARAGYGAIDLALPDGGGDLVAQYEAYLQANSDAMRAGLLDGTLGAAQRLIAG